MAVKEQKSAVSISSLTVLQCVGLINKLVAEVNEETFRIFGKTNRSYFSNGVFEQASVAASA